MLLEIAVGDAYGAGFEFAPESKVRRFNSVTAYQPHALGISPGNYTDDTQMSIALSLLLIEGVMWTRENIANKFLECFKRDERLGYSKGFFKFLKSVSSGEELLSKINPKSTRNGACMRAAPLGVINNIDQMLLYSEIQAKITHDTEIGVKSSHAVSLCSYYFLKEIGPKSDLLEFVNEYTKYKWNASWQQPVACCGNETTHALITVLSNSDSLKSVLINSVAFCGDVDTVAALALGIAAQSSQYQKDLPSFLFDELENGPYGKKYLSKLGCDLLALNNKNSKISQNSH